MAKMSTSENSRRRFLKWSATGFTALSTVSLLNLRVARSQDLPQLEESDPTAQALSYVHDAQQSSEAPDGQVCSNCQLYTGAEGEQWGPCAIFPGKGVNANGWCKSWVKKSS